MIYSKSRDFLFIKGKKVAGTSVEIALAAVCGPEDIIGPMTPIDEVERLRAGAPGAQNYSDSRSEERKYLQGLLAAADAGALPAKSPRGTRYTQHMSLKQFIRAHGDLPTDRIFCVERCPYAKIISDANMANNNFNLYRREGKPMTSSIDEIRAVISQRIRRKDRRVLLSCRNINLYRDFDDKIRARALRYENLAAEFAELMHEYGIHPAPSLPHAKPGIKSNGLDPREIFTRDQLDVINEEFAPEFKTFGYARL